MFTVIAVLGAGALFAAAANRFGVESRPGFDERPETVRFGPLS